MRGGFRLGLGFREVVVDEGGELGVVGLEGEKVEDLVCVVREVGEELAEEIEFEGGYGGGWGEGEMEEVGFVAQSNLELFVCRRWWGLYFLLFHFFLDCFLECLLHLLELCFIPVLLHCLPLLPALVSHNHLIKLNPQHPSYIRLRFQPFLPSRSSCSSLHHLLNRCRQIR